jgi:hypothetical protein
MAPLLHRFPPIRPRLHPKVWRNQGGGVVGDPAKVPGPAPSCAGRGEANPPAKLPIRGLLYQMSRGVKRLFLYG